MCSELSRMTHGVFHVTPPIVWARLICRGVLALLLVAPTPIQALACGTALATCSSAEQAPTMFANDHKQRIVGVQLKRDKPDAAVILPVLRVPEGSVLQSNELFSHLEEVTRSKLRSRAPSIARRFEPWPAARIQPFDMFARRAALPDAANQEHRLSPGAIIGLICAIAASSVALGVAFGLRRRIDRIAGPDPDKADDD